MFSMAAADEDEDDTAQIFNLSKNQKHLIQNYIRVQRMYTIISMRENRRTKASPQWPFLIFGRNFRKMLVGTPQTGCWSYRPDTISFL